MQERSGRVVVFSASVVLPITAPPIRDGAIAVAAGRIRHVGDRAWVLRELHTRGVAFDEVHWPGVLTPGPRQRALAPAVHRHGRGGAGAVRGLRGVGARVPAVYERGLDWGADAAAGARAMIAAGTTAVADIVTDVEAASALHDARLHGITYWEVMSWTNEAWAERGRAEVEARLDALPAPPGTGLSPHAPYSLDVEPLLEIPDIVRERGVACTCTWARRPSSASTARRCRGRRASGELHGAARRGHRHGRDGVRRRARRAGPDCHIAHGVYMTARDRATLRSRGTTVALCPRSNAVIGLDEPADRRLSRRGQRDRGGDRLLGIQPLSRPSRRRRRAAPPRAGAGVRQPRPVGAAAAGGDLGGAHAMGLDTGPARTGYLAVGAVADLAFFDIPGPAASPAAMSEVDDTIEHLVVGGAGRAAATFIDGEVLGHPPLSPNRPECAHDRRPAPPPLACSTLRRIPEGGWFRRMWTGGYAVDTPRGRDRRRRASTTC